MRVGLPVSVSLAAHVALFTWAPAPRWDHLKMPSWDAVTITISPEDPQEWEPLPAIEPAIDLRPVSRPVAGQRAAPGPSLASDVAVESPAGERMRSPDPVTEGTPGGAPVTIDLSPAAVARAGQPADRGPIQPGEIERARETALNDFLRADARAGHPGTRRPPPELHPRVDGSYDFQGHVFAARIAPDGEVSFEDRPNVQVSGLGGSFDITDAIERRLGNDPYSAERRWFLRETEALRARLAAEVWEEDAPRRLAHFRAGLARTWARRAPARERRASLFEAWDECAEDGVGAEARAATLAFVRDRLPAGSPDAFRASELVELNARRRSRARFSPYEGTPDQ